MAKMRVGADRRKAQRRITREIAQVGYALPGTLTVRSYRCGKDNCRCHSDPNALHGPYNYWTRKVGATTKTRVLTDAQLDEYRQWFDNARRLKELVAQLHELTVAITDEDPRGLRADRAKRVAKKSTATMRKSKGSR
jgi:hypothetical protein